MTKQITHTKTKSLGRPIGTKSARHANLENPIYVFRTATGLMQKEIAQRIGMQTASINRYENDLQLPKTKALNALNELLSSYEFDELTIEKNILVFSKNAKSSTAEKRSMNCDQPI